MHVDSISRFPYERAIAMIRSCLSRQKSVEYAVLFLLYGLEIVGQLREGQLFSLTRSLAVARQLYSAAVQNQNKKIDIGI